MIDYICDVCGTKFTDKPSQNRRYCSRDCYYKANQGRPRRPKAESVTVKCASCDTKFKVHASKHQRRTTARFFCSTACRDAGASTKVPCDCLICGKTSWIKPSELERISGRGRYCSMACKIGGTTTSIECECQHCFKHFKVAPSLFDRGVGVYCSIKCRSEAKSLAGTVSTECLECGRPFRAMLSSVAKGWGKYCGQTCRDDARRTSEELACQICGNEFLATPSQIAAGTRFCSRECVDQWQRESPEARTFQLANLRKQLARKEPTRCERVLYQLMAVVFGDEGFEKEFPLGYWTVDTAVPEFLLVVQADGDFWHGKIKPKKGYPEYVKETMARDKSANTYMRNRGWTVLRFWESDLMGDPEACLAEIQRVAVGLTAESGDP